MTRRRGPMVVAYKGDQVEMFADDVCSMNVAERESMARIMDVNPDTLAHLATSVRVGFGLEKLLARLNLSLVMQGIGTKHHRSIAHA